jgi:hypothetical protein
MSYKIAILGMGMSGIRKADAIHHFTEGYEVWSLNNAMVTYPDVKFARYFELHARAYVQQWKWAEGRNGQPLPIAEYYKRLNALKCEVMTGEPHKEIVNQSEYPFVKVFEHFKLPAGGVYFLGSPSLMLALALYEHDNGKTIDELISFGIDTNDRAHGQQRASWMFWLSQYIARGIKIGGTALECFNEWENDDGLRGLREHIERQIKERSGGK